MSMKNISMVILALMLIISAASSTDISGEAEQAWKKIKEEKNITVYSRGVSDSDLIMVKAEVVIGANMQTIQSILDDVPNRKKWIPYLIESRVLAEHSLDEKLEYGLFDAPWPVSDRDFVYLKKLLHKDDKNIVFEMKTVESGLMPEQDWIVRADMIDSQYILATLNNKKTKVELIFYADFKGWLPDWIINQVQEMLPFITLRNLKAMAERACCVSESLEETYGLVE